jgi:hypothetical protein
MISRSLVSPKQNHISEGFKTMSLCSLFQIEPGYVPSNIIELPNGAG